MGRYFAVIAILVWASTGIASAACSSAPAVKAPATLPVLAPLMGGIGGGPQLYYCMPSASPTTLGELTPNDFAKNVQVCNTSCDYQPMVPNDPHALLVPMNCGAGWHEPQFMVQPPPPPKADLASTSVKLTTTTCNGLLPSKAPPPPAPAPTARPRA